MYALTRSLIVLSVIFPSLACLAVALRIQARWIKQRKLTASDYWIFVTLVSAIGQGILSIVGASEGGLGAPLSTLSPSVSELFMKVLFGSQFFLISSIVFVKVSIILFYREIFITKSFRLAANFALAMLAATWVALFFVTIFQDKPISRNWTDQGTTIDFTVLYIFEAAIEVAYDLIVLFFPLPMIRGLQMSTKRKWQLASIFWLGGFCVISSIVRLGYCIEFFKQYRVEDDDFSGTVVNMIIWATIGPSTQVIAACLPTLGALFKERHTAPSTTTNTLRQLEHGHISRATKRARHESISSEEVDGKDIAMGATPF